MNAQKYRENRTKDELDALLHYDFFIPISRGFTADFVEKNYPGWTWNALIGVLNAAGVRVARPGRPSVCHEDVVRMQFDSEQSWRVEWKNGSVTEGPALAGTTQPASPSAIETGIHDLSSGQMGELPGTAEAIAGQASEAEGRQDGWPADEFTRAWADILADAPAGADRWEYRVIEPQPEDPPHTSLALPIDEALERVRAVPGARLQRRAVGRWQTVRTPFPELTKPGWEELEDEKQTWHAALYEFPPSYRGTVSRMGGVDATPQDWIGFARRAAAAGFTPSAYRLLGTAHLAWQARPARSERPDPGPLPALQSIEVWARFPGLLSDGASPFEAIERIVTAR